MKLSAQEAGAVEVNSNAPKFKFETESIDYGTLKHNANGSREFKFTNVGKEPLIIISVPTGCGCLISTYPKEPIKPGESGVIKATYDTHRVGRFEKTMIVNSNADRPQVSLKIKGIVLPPKNDSTAITFPSPK